MSRHSPDKKQKQAAINSSYIRNVYAQIMTKYGKQSINSTIEDTKSYKINFDALPLYKTNSLLPKLEFEDKNNFKGNKYYSNRLIVNESVFIHQRKQKTLKQLSQMKKYSTLSRDGEQFQKIDLPIGGEKGVLADRNKRIWELYRKVEQTKNAKIVAIKANYPSSMMRIQSKQRLQIYDKEDPQEMMIKKKPSRIESSQNSKLDHSLISLSKQKDRKSTIKFPKMNSNLSENSLKPQFLDSDVDAEQVLKCTKYQVLQRHSVKIRQDPPTQSISSPSNNPHTRNKSEIKVGNDLTTLSPVRKRKFLWKKQPFNLQRINKQQLHVLLRGYAKIGPVQQINSGFYRAFVGWGNNNALIKKVIKERSYWTIVDSLDDEPHFVWTQLKNTAYSNSLPLRQSISDSFVKNPLNINDLSVENDNELKLFLKLKSNDFIQGCQRILQPKIFMRLMRDIKQRFKCNGYLLHFRKIKNQAMEILPDYKFSGKEQCLKAYDLRLHNHVDGTGAIGNKKNLFHFIAIYAQIFNQNVYDMLPETVHIDTDFFNSDEIFKVIPEGPWILKPGQETNRGQGITIHLTQQCLLAQLSKKKEHYRTPEVKYTNIVQKYITPVLYNGRKFDIRIWILWNGSSRQAWWYQQGYIRTSSKEFTFTNTNKFVHLTNDAIQSQGDQFGKFEPANKISFNELNKYFETVLNYKLFYEELVPKMKELALKVFRIGNLVFDPKNKQHSFELFGFDFLIDQQFKPWLIECNTNPCLQINCSLLTRLVTNLVQNIMVLTLDTYFPPPTKRKPKEPPAWHHQNFKFQLLYDGNQDSQIKEKIEKLSDIDLSYEEQFYGV